MLAAVSKSKKINSIHIVLDFIHNFSEIDFATFEFQMGKLRFQVKLVKFCLMLYFTGLMRLVLSESMMKVVVEVCRVFGNLTRQKQVRDYLAEQKGKL